MNFILLSVLQLSATVEGVTWPTAGRATRVCCWDLISIPTYDSHFMINEHFERDSAKAPHLLWTQHCLSFIEKVLINSIRSYLIVTHPLIWNLTKKSYLCLKDFLIRTKPYGWLIPPNFMLYSFLPPGLLLLKAL